MRGVSPHPPLPLLALVLLLLVPARPLWGDSAVDAVRARVAHWREAWQAADMDRYAECYHPAFLSEAADYGEWMRRKENAFRRGAPFSVEIFGLSVFLESGHAVARFFQRYRSAAHADTGQKTLILEKHQGVWKILSEEWEPAPRGVRLPDNPAEPEPGPPAGDAGDAVAPPSAAAAPRGGGAAPSGAAPESGEPGIRYRREPGGEEWVCIRLDRFFIPRIFDLSEGKPRVVIDIGGVSRWEHNGSIPAGGKRIRRIRSFLHREEQRLRVVLDLEPADNYTVSQTHFPDKNAYCVGVDP